MLNNSKDQWCFTCGNKGFHDKVCPACGKEPTSVAIDLDSKTEKELDSFVKKIDLFGVPEMYRGVFWSSEVLRHHFPEKEVDGHFDRYVKQLDKIHSIFAAGRISPKSAFIIAPAGYSKMVFTYSCIQHALDHGLTVAPVLDTLELKRLLTLAAENPNHVMYGGINYDQYVMADVCFVTVTKLPAKAWAFEVVQELIDKRARKGLGTIVLSRYDLSEISAMDSSNQFEAIMTAKVHDEFKYPAIIRYKNY